MQEAIGIVGEVMGTGLLILGIAWAALITALPFFVANIAGRLKDVIQLQLRIVKLLEAIERQQRQGAERTGGQ